MLILILLLGYFIGYVIGHRRGWKDGIHIARLWEGCCRDWRMMYDTAIADTEEGIRAAKERREIERMYDGY